MVKMVNKLTGGDMYVHESRVDEYIAAGHKLAAPPVPAHPLIPEEQKKKPKKPKE